MLQIIISSLLNNLANSEYDNFKDSCQTDKIYKDCFEIIEIFFSTEESCKKLISNNFLAKMTSILFDGNTYERQSSNKNVASDQKPIHQSLSGKTATDDSNTKQKSSNVKENSTLSSQNAQNENLLKKFLKNLKFLTNYLLIVSMKYHFLRSPIYTRAAQWSIFKKNAQKVNILKVNFLFFLIIVHTKFWHLLC